MSGESVLNVASVPAVQSNAVQEVLTTVSTVRSGERSIENPASTMSNTVSWSDIFEREAMISQVGFNETGTVNGLMGGYFDPFSAFIQLPFIAEKLKGYTGISGDLEVIFKTTVPGSCTGLLVAGALCEGGQNPYGTPSTETDPATKSEPATMVQDIFGLINLELANTVRLTLPWINYENYHRLNDADGPRCWQIGLATIAPVQSCIAATASGRIQIFARLLPGFKLYGLELESAPNTTHKVSKGLSMASSAMGSSLAKAVVGPLATPAAAGLAAASTIADMLGFTREAAPVQPVMVTNRLFSSIGQVDGMDTSEVAGLFNGNAVSIDPTLTGGCPVDPMSFESLLPRWTLMETLTIANTIAAGTTMTTFPVTPCIIRAARAPSTGYILSPAGYVAVPFSQWRGGMEFMLYVSSGSSVRGTLVVAWEANVNAARTFASDPSNRVNSVSIDLCGSTATHLHISPATHLTTLDAEFISTANKSLATNRTANGQLIFYLQSEVTTTKVTPFNVGVHIFMRAKEDMRFGVPRAILKVNGTEKYLGNVRLEMDTGGTITDELLTHTDIDLIPKGGDYSPSLTQWGEEFLSVRPLLQRFSLMRFGAAFSFAGTSGDPARGPFLPHFMPSPVQLSLIAGYSVDSTWINIEPYTTTPAYVASQSSVVPWSWSGWFAAPFVGLRASSRVKFVASSSNSQAIAAATATGRELTSNVTTGYDWATYFPCLNMSDVQQLSYGTSGIEVCFPFYSQLKYWCPKWTMDTLKGTSYMLNGMDLHYNRMFFAVQSSSIFPYGSYFIACGADVSVSRFRRIPVILFV